MYIMDVELVDITIDDLEQIRTWRNSNSVSQYMYTSDQITSEQQINWFNKIKNDSSQKYWIIKYDNLKIGVVSIYNIKYNFKHCSWAFYLGNTELRGLGIGAKVEYNILYFVFEIMKFHKLNCEVFSFNEGVIKMHEKFGFHKEGLLREYIYKDGRFYDVVVLSILNQEWQNIKNKLKYSIYNK